MMAVWDGVHKIDYIKYSPALLPNNDAVEEDNDEDEEGSRDTQHFFYKLLPFV